MIASEGRGKEEINRPAGTASEKCPRAANDYPMRSNSRHSTFDATCRQDNSHCVQGRIDRDGRSSSPCQAQFNLDSPGQVDDPSISDADIAHLTESNAYMSVSALTNRAEKLLQDRRRKTFEKPTSPSLSELESPIELDDSDLNFDELDDEPEPVVPTSSELQQVKWTNKYRRTSRFLDPEEPDVSSTANPDDFPFQVNSHSGNKNALTERMSLVSKNTAAADEKNNSTTNGRSKTSNQRRRHERKRRPEVDYEDPIDITACKSVDSVKEVASGFFAGSFNFEKLVSVVDDQFSALRDLVGVPSEEDKLKKKRTLRIPTSSGLDPFDVEDVAIEVEYVDNGSSQEGVHDYDESFDFPLGDTSNGICSGSSSLS